MLSDTMSLSRSAVERGNPPTRQKACRACTQAKRRCDLREPACLRCANRQVACVYPRKHGRGVPRCPARETTDPSPIPTPDAVADLRAGLTTAYAPLPASATRADEQFGVWPPDLWLFPHSPGPRSALGDSCLSVPDLSEFPSQGPFPPWELDFPAALEILDPASDINPGLKRKERMPVGTRVLATPDVRDVIMRTHLQYAIDEVRAGPRSTVLQNGTPWSHPALYRDDTPPRCMQDAYACCALYLSKNNANAPLVLRIIDSRAAELAGLPLPTEPSALLAHTQAMLLYLILQLFDGDVSSRASAESRMQNLQAAVLAMTIKLPPASAVAAMDTIGDYLSLQTSMGLGIVEAQKFWTEWVFEESRRRTCMVSFFFLQAYSLLNGTAEYACYNYDEFPANRLEWTVSAHLWKADSVGQFLRFWGNKKRFYIKRFDMDDALAHGQPEDLDVYSRMMFTSIMGIDEIESWLGARGSTLR